MFLPYTSLSPLLSAQPSQHGQSEDLLPFVPAPNSTDPIEAAIPVLIVLISLNTVKWTVEKLFEIRFLYCLTFHGNIV